MYVSRTGSTGQNSYGNGLTAQLESPTFSIRIQNRTQLGSRFLGLAYIELGWCIEEEEEEDPLER
jgi:hypothetical protein